MTCDQKKKERTNWCKMCRLNINNVLPIFILSIVLNCVSQVSCVLINVRGLGQVQGVSGDFFLVYLHTFTSLSFVSTFMLHQIGSNFIKSAFIFRSKYQYLQILNDVLYIVLETLSSCKNIIMYPMYIHRLEILPQILMLTWASLMLKHRLELSDSW